MEKEPRHVLEIPTWHRHKGNLVPLRTDAEIQMENSQIPWDHFRHRVSDAYRAAMAIRQPQLV